MSRHPSVRARRLSLSRLAVGLLAGTMTVGCLAALSATATADGAASQPVARSPRLQQFHGVDGVAADDVWAVGQYDNSTPLARHWDGKTWRLTPVPGEGLLLSVYAATTDDVWAVGSQPGNAANKILVEHWDGTAWSEVPVPQPVCYDSWLASVSAVGPDHVLASGICSHGEDGDPIRLLWNGSEWKTAGPGYANVPYEAGDGSDGWGVGGAWYQGTLAKHWDGRHWERVQTPDYPGGASRLVDVAAVSPQDAWTVGQRYTGTEHVFSEHWDGTRWSLIDLPQPAPYTILSVQPTGITATPTGQAWMCGYTYTFGFIEHWDGSAWSLQGNLASHRYFSELHDIKAFSDDDVWAVGWTEQPLLLHWDGRRWTNEAPPNG